MKGRTMMRRMPDWATVYDQADVTTMPWFHPVLDADVAEQVSLFGHPYGKRLLDLGSGPGNQANELHKLGFSVVGSDISLTAVMEAQQAYPNVTYIHDNILHTVLTETFAVVLDRGCFHVFSPEQRPAYVASVHNLLAPQGQLWLKCFSTDTPGEDGPYRYTPDTLKAVFEPHLTLESIKPTEYFGQLATNPKAWFAVLTRT
jgi:cyclopropane fatty-acyl-phospholipid synthase-like methyltransferase